MRRSHALLYAVVLLLLILAPLYIGPYNLALLGRFLAMGILAIGIALVWGNAGILPLGQGLFFGLGGYAVAMHLKLASLGPGEIPDFMQWNGLDSLPWLWLPFQSGLFSLAAALIVPTAIAGGLRGWYFTGGSAECTLRSSPRRSRSGRYHVHHQPAAVYRRLQWPNRLR